MVNEQKSLVIYIVAAVFFFILLCLAWQAGYKSCQEGFVLSSVG